MNMEFAVLIVRVVVAGLACFIIPEVKRWLRTKTENTKLNRVKDWAYTAVSSAEQWYCKKHPGTDPTGDKRREYARNTIYDICRKYDVDLSMQEIDALIEAAVNEMNILKSGGAQIVQATE